MPAFIAVHTRKGKTVYVNVDHILELHDEPGATVLEYEGPDQHRNVSESVADVLALRGKAKATLVETAG